MKFSEMPYSRPDMDALKAEYNVLIDKVKNAECADEVFEAVARHEELSSHMQTMGSIAYVRHTINTEDEYYTAENEFFNTTGPLFGETMQEFMLALFASKFRPEMEEKYGSLLFKNMEMELKTFSPEVIPLLQEENRLTSEYQKLVASAKIDFDGKTLNISQLGAYKENPERETRHAAYIAETGFYMANAEELDRLYDELVRVRTEIAHKLGFKSFTELAYLRRTRNCYDPEMVANFRQQVINDIVPIVRSLKSEQAKRIGIPEAEMMMWDDGFHYPEGNPKPVGKPADILAAGKKMYEEMSPETAEFINFMYDNELLDVEAKPGKAVGGYCTSFPEFKAPFIFSNFNGTSGDVDVLTHEAGHAFAGYRQKDAEILETVSPTMESCECHSMSMEFLAWPWLNLYYGDDMTARAKFSHLEGALLFIPYGTMVDHFQHIVYDNPTLTPAERHEKWLELEKTYRPYLKFGDLPFYGDGRGWQRQLHIYMYPFYYIDYCLAQTVALIFWSLSQNDYKNAWDRYLKFVDLGGTKTFVELCETAEIKTPFDDGALRTIANAAHEWLEKTDK